MSDSEQRLKVLFLCTGNSCRSQMAEAWARHLKGTSVDAHSAGTAPQGLNPLAVQVMEEAGVNMDGLKSKHVDEFLDYPLDFVVTVCGSARDGCPVFSRPVESIHAGFDDPPQLAMGAKSHEEALQHYRRVRDEIKKFVEQLPETLGAKGK
ncbi:MAG: arsenate reductase ArsC [Candidatus Hydrogenedentes bacterium]|nr:arsenate reductase ArsC [Candidatus Hydrogenedentota bacterium]